MKNAVLFATLSASLALGGCFGPGDPVELPDDAIEAASTCFAAQGMVMRAGKGEDVPVTYDEFVTAIKYPMVAATEVEPFSVETVMKILNGAEAKAEEIRSKDYEGAVATCDARFKIKAGEATLPENNGDAILSCMGLASFVQGAVQSQGSEFGGDADKIGALTKRLEGAMSKDPDVLTRLIGGDPEAVMMEALKGAFAQGNPDAYVKACDKRFPAS